MLFFADVFQHCCHDAATALSKQVHEAPYSSCSIMAAVLKDICREQHANVYPCDVI